MHVNHTNMQPERSSLHIHMNTQKFRQLTLLKNRKAQSALEYMMTYGWAILIIVIVAVILYSMGIFSPASSISSTITGFSGLGVTNAQCFSNNGMVVLFTNNIGQPINLTKVMVSIGSTITGLNLSHIVLAGSISTIFIPIQCGKGGSHFFATVSITYTEPSSVFKGPYLSSGTVSGQPSAYTLQNAYGWAFGTYVNEHPSQFGVDADNGSAGYGLDYSGVSTYGLIENSNFPITDLNTNIVNSTGSCGGSTQPTPEGYTAIGTMYFTNATINFSSYVDDSQAIWYKLPNESSWTLAASFVCCKLNTHSVNLIPGLYDVMVQWENSCGGGTTSMFVTNAFMEYSLQWSITSWDGYSLTSTLTNQGSTPSGDIFESTSSWSGQWP